MNPTSYPLPSAWESVVGNCWRSSTCQQLRTFLDDEYAQTTVFPPAGHLFTALELTPPEAVKAVILGQDPYHGQGQAHGLSFSVQAGVKTPASLNNIYKELQSDLGLSVPKGTGDLTPWARQGVLLLNAVLTVREAQPLSHKGKGWEMFTDAILRAMNDGPHRVAFVLWGAHAQKKRDLVDTTRHAVIESAHPSPLSARTGFFGSKPFSRVNAALKAFGREPIDWRL